MTAQTLTFLFTDIEGSTALVQRLGDAYAQTLADHRRLIRDVLAAYDALWFKGTARPLVRHTPRA